MWTWRGWLRGEAFDSYQRILRFEIYLYISYSDCNFLRGGGVSYTLQAYVRMYSMKSAQCPSQNFAFHYSRVVPLFDALLSNYNSVIKITHMNRVQERRHDDDFRDTETPFFLTSHETVSEIYAVLPHHRTLDCGFPPLRALFDPKWSHVGLVVICVVLSDYCTGTSAFWAELYCSNCLIYINHPLTWRYVFDRHNVVK
jgi:hypothetical protein